MACWLVVFSLLGIASAAWAGAHEEVAQIRQQWLQTFHEGNAEALAGLYGDEAHFTPATTPFRVEGRAAVRAQLAGFMGAFPTRRLALRQISLRVYGDTAVENGYFDMTVVDRAGKVTMLHGRYTTVSVKAGTRREIVETHVSLLPPPQ